MVKPTPHCFAYIICKKLPGSRDLNFGIRLANFNLLQKHVSIIQHLFSFDMLKSSLSIQFWSGFNAKNGGGRIYPTLTAISPTPLSISLDSWHPPSPSFIVSSTSSLVALASSSLHFKLQRFSQTLPFIPPQHMPVPSHSIRLFHLNYCFLQSQHLH